MKIKLQKNPILQKELQTGARNMRMSLAVMGVNAVLVLLLMIVMLSLQGNQSRGYAYSELAQMFPKLAILEVVLFSFMVPIMTAGSISGERERQTLDIMLTTPMKPMAIISGKLQATMAVVMMYIVSTIPVLAVPFIFGGMSWWRLAEYLLLLLYLGIYVGSVGIFCSSLLKRSAASTVVTIALGIGIVLFTIIGFSVSIYSKVENPTQTVNLGFSALWLVGNPYAPFFEFYLQCIDGSSMQDLMKELGNSVHIMELLYQWWMVITTVFNLGIAYGFRVLAAKQLYPKDRRKNRSKKA